MVRLLLARRLPPSSPPPLLAACLCVLFGGACLVPEAHAAKILRTPLELIGAANTGERADVERGLFDEDGSRGREGPYMGVPRADLKMTRGLDFDLQREGSGLSWQNLMGANNPGSTTWNTLKLKQLRVSVARRCFFFYNEGSLLSC
jgi:hypothetical protein